MSLPQVRINELDGALGILPPTAGKLYALVGAASAGPTNTPATFARIKDVIVAFGSGPLVEAAAHYIERYGRPVLLVRTGASTAAAASAVTADATGTSVVTVDAETAAVDDFQAVVQILNGGTVGTAGATYRTSLDGGRTFGPKTALGTAHAIVVPGAGVTLALGTGTLVAGDLYAATLTAAHWNPGELGAALDALALSAATWELVHVVGVIDSAAFDVVEGKVAGMLASGKPHAWIGNVAIPTAGETEAAYAAQLAPLSAAKATKYGSLCAGAIKLVSSISGRVYRRPVSFAYAAMEASVSEETDTADINLGLLAGVSIRDDNGNLDEHDEAASPGLDDLRYVTLCTQDGNAGVYVTRPRCFSPEGSDFFLLPHRRVLNVAHDALRQYFRRRLNKPIRVNAATGFILEAEALEIEAGARAVMRGTLLAKPKASGIQFTLSRTDNIISTRTLRGQARVLPLAYPEFIDLDVGYTNAALQAQAV
jgi:hypothetical protein